MHALTRPIERPRGPVTSTRRSWRDGWLHVVGVALGVAAVAVVMAAASNMLLALMLTALVGLSVALLTKTLRRPLLVAFFFLAPIDISKAVIAPLTSRYY